MTNDIKNEGLKIALLGCDYPLLTFKVENLIKARLDEIEVLVNDEVVRTFNSDLDFEKTVDMTDIDLTETNNVIEIKLKSIAIRA